METVIAEKLSGIYAALEDKYYSFLDFLDGKGVPVYAYNDFLEEKGIPPFPLTVAVLLLVIAGITAFVSIGTGTGVGVPDGTPELGWFSRSAALPLERASRGSVRGRW